MAFNSEWGRGWNVGNSSGGWGKMNAWPGMGDIGGTLGDMGRATGRGAVFGGRMANGSARGAGGHMMSGMGSAAGATGRGFGRSYEHLKKYKGRYMAGAGAAGIAVGGGAWMVHHRHNSSGRHDAQYG